MAALIIAVHLRVLAPAAVSKDWIVYYKPPSDGPAYVLYYFGRYIHRVAISNQDWSRSTTARSPFVDAILPTTSAHNDEQKLTALSLHEFLGRFLRHLLPEGFVAATSVSSPTAARAQLLPLCFSGLDSTPVGSMRDIIIPDRFCPKCGGSASAI